MNGERRAWEDIWGRLCNPARLAQPQQPALRTSHFPDPPTTTLRRPNQPLDKHRGTQRHDLARHTPDDPAAVATALNGRPRKTLGWRTPAEALNDHLLLAAQEATVATTH